MELWRKGTAGTTGDCLYQDPMVILNSTADKTEGVSDNVNTCLKVKQEASGWPAWCTLSGMEGTRNFG